MSSDVPPRRREHGSSIPVRLEAQERSLNISRSNLIAGLEKDLLMSTMQARHRDPALTLCKAVESELHVLKSRIVAAGQRQLDTKISSARMRP
jgi:hypothetical protein